MSRLNALYRLAEARPEIAANPLQVMDAHDRGELLSSLLAETTAAVTDGSSSRSRKQKKGIGIAIGMAAAVVCLVAGLVLVAPSSSPRPSGAATTLVTLHSTTGTIIYRKTPKRCHRPWAD